MHRIRRQQEDNIVTIRSISLGLFVFNIRSNIIHTETFCA